MIFEFPSTPPILGFFWVAFWFIAKMFVYASIAYGLGRLMAPGKPKEEPTAEGMAGRAWDSKTTQTEGFPRPRCYGENLHHGNILAKWTDVVTTREILYLLIDHGDGPTKGIGDNVTYVNDQPSTNFPDVTIQERTGTMNQDCMTGFEKLKLEYTPEVELKQGVPYIWTTPNDFFDNLEWTFIFPNGLLHRHKDGGIMTTWVTLQIDIREHPDGEWTYDVFSGNISGETLNPMFIKHTASTLGFTVEKGKQYDIRFMKTTGESTDRHTADIYVRSIREVVNTAFTHPGKALIGVTAIATNQLSGSIDIKVAREDRIINVYNGESWTLEYSRNRAWVVWDIVTHPIIYGDGNGTPYEIVRYEGYDPANLDLEFFYEWSLFCDEELLDGDGGTEPRCPCDIKIGAFTNIMEIATQIANAGRAHIYWNGDKLTGWIDTVVAAPTDLVTMDTMMHKTWKNSWTIRDEMANIVEVMYDDAKQGYEETTADYGNSGTGYVNAVGVEGTGLTSRGAAIHLAAFHYKRNELIRNINKFRTGKEGFRYKLGDVIRLQCKIANWGNAFTVKSSTADTITVDRDATAEVNPGDILHIRSYDTVLEQVVNDDYIVDSVVERIITATENWDVTPVKGNIVAVGSSGDIKLRRITSIKPTIDNYFDVTVETYDPDLYDSDDIDPDNPNINYIYPKPPGHLTPPITRREIEDMIIQRLPVQPSINVPWPSNLTWAGDDVDTVTWSKTDADDEITFRYGDTTYIITADSTTKKYIYWDPGSPTVFLSTNVLTTALAAGNWMMAINENGVVSSANPFQIIHGGLIQAGTITAEYAQIANATIETAKIKDLAVETLKIANNAVTTLVSEYTEALLSGAGGNVTAQTCEITTTGSPVHIQATGKIVIDAGAGTQDCYFFIKRNGDIIYATDLVKYLKDATYATNQIVNLAFRDETAGAGDWTYTFVFTAPSMSKRFLFVQEVKK